MGSFNSVFHGMNYSICLKIPKKKSIKKNSYDQREQSDLGFKPLANVIPVTFQLLHSYSRKCSKFFKKRFHKKKKKFISRILVYVLKKIDSEFFFFKKIPMTKVSNLTWASNPWPK